MPRKPRLLAEGLYHHIVHRGIDRQCIFRNDADRYAFLRRVEKLRSRFDVEVMAYCLMDNHYHLLVRDPHAQLSAFMAILNGAYTQAFNARHGRDGALLRGRFYSRPSDEPRYALCALRYIHLNPVAAGVVSVPGAYLWSSHRALLGELSSHYVSTHHALGLLRAIGVMPRQIDAWVRNPKSSFVYSTVPSEEIVTGVLRKNQNTADAGEERATSINQVKRSEVLNSRQLRCQLTLRAVAKAYGLPEQAITSESSNFRGSRSQARYLIAYICYTANRATYKEIATLLHIAPGSAGVFVQRGEEVSEHRKRQQENI